MSTSALHIGLFAFLGLTVVLLGVVLALAKLHKVNAHIGAVAAMVVSLLVTVYFAETVGRRYDFEATSYAIHIPLAIAATLASALPIGSGFLHWRKKIGVKPHKVAVGIWIALVLAALGTGAWMISAGQLKPEFASAGGAPTPPAAGTPAAETPAAETPAAETPAVETPAVETPRAE